MVPVLDGLSVIRALRAAKVENAGADPVGAGLGRRPHRRARVRVGRLSGQAILVRGTAGAGQCLASAGANRGRPADPRITVGDLEIDPLSRIVQTRRQKARPQTP